MSTFISMCSPKSEQIPVPIMGLFTAKATVAPKSEGVEHRGTVRDVHGAVSAAWVDRADESELIVLKLRPWAW